MDEANDDVAGASAGENSGADSGRVILMHGFSGEDAIAAMRAVKTAFPGADIAFATSTPTNLEWKLSRLVGEVRDEHETMKKNR